MGIPYVISVNNAISHCCLYIAVPYIKVIGSTSTVAVKTDANDNITISPVGSAVGQYSQVNGVVLCNITNR